ncbi:SDR family oxidoreductase [soil metagenome]
MAPRAVVIGGAGFIGSHLCERLLAEDWDVLCLDSAARGSARTLNAILRHDRFAFGRSDTSGVLHVDGPVDWVFYLPEAARAGHGEDLARRPPEDAARGARRALALARSKGAGLLLVTAYRETEAAGRIVERARDVPAIAVRIGETFGPRMPRGGGPVGMFLERALRGDVIPLGANASEALSVCYVDDLVEGIWLAVQSQVPEPTDVGRPVAVTRRRLAELISVLAGRGSVVVPAGEADGPSPPRIRSQDLVPTPAGAGSEGAPLLEGLSRTIEWAREVWTTEKRDARSIEEPSLSLPTPASGG